MGVEDEPFYELDEETYNVMIATYNMLENIKGWQATDEAATLVDSMQIVLAVRFGLDVFPEDDFDKDDVYRIKDRPPSSTPPIVTINGKPHLRLVEEEDEE